MTARYAGIVQKGSGSGRKFGFPTANIPLTDESLSGIYAATVTLDGHAYQSAVYADTRRKLLEAHLMDFEGDLYGKEITIELHEKTREDRPFTSEQDARKTIQADIEAVRAYLRRVN